MSGSLFNLFGPTDAQNAIAAGNWTDPAALQAYRQQDLGNLAYQIGRASQQGLGPGTLFGMFGGGWAGAGVPGTQGAMAEKAKMDLNQAQALLAGQQAYAVPSEIELRQAQTQQALFNTWMARERLRLAQLPMPGDEGSSGSSGAPAASDGTYRGTLASSESGGNFGAKPNEGGYAGGYQFGAPRLKDLGLYTPGADEDWDAKKNQWSGTFNIPDMPNIKTLDDFLASPEAQHKAQAASELNTEKFIFSNGLDKYIGQTINGTPITYNGMQAVAHLGGNAGLARYLTSNGDYNPADARGTKLSDYMGKFANVGVAPGLSQPQRTLVAGPGAGTQNLPPVDTSRPPPTAAGAPPGGLNPNQATIAAPPTGPQTPPTPQPQLESAPDSRTAYERAKATGRPVQITSTPGYAATPDGNVVPIAQATAVPAQPSAQPPVQSPTQPPAQPPAASAAPQGPSLTLPGGIQLTPQTAYAQYRQLMDLARRSELSGINMYGDPAALRQSAQKFLDYAIKPSQAAAEEAAKAGVQLQFAGPKAAAEANARLPAEMMKDGWQFDQQGRLTPVPGGKADPAYIGQSEAAKAQAQAMNKIDVNRNGDVFYGGKWIGRGPMQIWNGKDYQWVGPSAGVASPGSDSAFQAPGGGPMLVKPGPTMQSFSEHYGAELGKKFEEVNDQAAASNEQNYMFDNMRNDSLTWAPDRFAEWKNAGRDYAIALGHLFNVPDDAMKEMLDKSSDYASYTKNAGMLLREAVHATSSRASQQEFQMIADTLPTAETPRQAFLQIADQWQGLNDYRIAKQKFMQQYQSHPQDFEADWNAKVSPTAFMLNRMSQTPEGQQQLARLFQTLKDKGQVAALQKMKHELDYVTGAGLLPEKPNG